MTETKRPVLPGLPPIASLLLPTEQLAVMAIAGRVLLNVGARTKEQVMVMLVDYHLNVRRLRLVHMAVSPSDTPVFADIRHIVTAMEHCDTAEARRSAFMPVFAANMPEGALAAPRYAGGINHQRAAWGSEAMETFEHATGTRDEPADTIMIDLISDIGHYADMLDLDFVEVLTKARGAWEAERSGEADE